MWHGKASRLRSTVDRAAPRVQVRLDRAALPAPAVASLYLTGARATTGAGMLSPERALYHVAVHLTWPHAMADDDEYLACFIAELLLSEAEPPAGDRHLPRRAAADSRLPA
jgi:hypothetical protein